MGTKDVLLTPHFSEIELNVNDCEDRVRFNALYLCDKVLEPLREQFNCPIVITSGRRTDKGNTLTGGVKTSEHLYLEDKAAADFFLIRTPVEVVFDFLRLNSGYPIDQVILEKDIHGEPSIIHVATRRETEPRYMALVGETHGAGVYHKVDFIKALPKPEGGVKI